MEIVDVIHIQLYLIDHYMYEDCIEIEYENQRYHHMFYFVEILMNYDLEYNLNENPINIDAIHRMDIFTNI